MTKPKPDLRSKPIQITTKKRPRDLLKLATTPIHPFDLAHGVDTSGLVPAAHLVTGHPNDEHVTAYYGVAPSILRTLITQWRETPPPYPIHDYTFIDFGAGKGRAMLVASELPFRAVIGIELNPGLATIAQQNLEHWLASHTADPTAPHLAPTRLRQQDALTFKLPPGPCVAFLFHPFEAPVLRTLLRRIETQFAAQAANQPDVAATFDILYVNAECRTVLDHHPAFTRLFLGPVPMSAEDHIADLAAIAAQKEYGSTGDEECAIYRYIGRSIPPAKTPIPR
jgi:hypothetical protein